MLHPTRRRELEINRYKIMEEDLYIDCPICKGTGYKGQDEDGKYIECTLCGGTGVVWEHNPEYLEYLQDLCWFEE